MWMSRRSIFDCTRPLVLATGLQLLALGSASAQTGPSVLQLLSNQGSAIIDGDVNGELTERDYLVRAGRRVAAWELDALDGEILLIDLMSSDFDPYLYVVGPGLGTGLTDDDGGSLLDARLCFVAPDDGLYQVVVGALAGEVGSYTLRVTPAQSVPGGGCLEPGDTREVLDLSTLETGGRVLSVGPGSFGELSSTDGTYYGSPVQAWSLEGRAGESVTVDLYSEAFDAQLMLLGPGLDQWLSDDDGAGRCDSRITVDFPEDGTYKVVASAIGSGGGAFELRAAEEPGLVSAEACIPMDVVGETSSGDMADLPEAGVIVPGSLHTGTLTDEGARWQNTAADRWTLTAEAEQRVAIDLTATDFDAYLYLAGPGFPLPVSDDDGGDEGFDSRLCVELSQSAEYSILASALGEAESGSYTLLVTDDPGRELCPSFEMTVERRNAMIVEMDVGGRTISSGQEVEGTLTAGQQLYPDDGSSVQAWSLPGVEGASISIDLISDAFDAFLRLAGPGLSEVLSDDDGAGRCDSRITLQFPATGDYVVIVGSLFRYSSGEYRMTASAEPGPMLEGTCGVEEMQGASTVSVSLIEGLLAAPGRELLVGYESEGQLTSEDATLEDGSHVQAWSLEATAGELLVIDLISEDFDAILLLHGPGLVEALNDDDGGTGINSRIVFTPPEDGTYRVVVNTLNAGETGSFRLSVLRRR